MTWRVVFGKQAVKDSAKAKAAGFKPKIEVLLDVLASNPYTTPPPYEKLLGDLSGTCSRRINLQHRLVYAVFESERTVRVLRMWTHCE